MSAPLTPLTYRFATPAQFAAGLLAGGSATEGGVSPVPVLGTQARLIWPGSVAAVAVATDGAVYWRDDAGRIHCLPPEADARPCAWDPADPALAGAHRLVAERTRLWAGGSGAASGFALPTLQPLGTVQAAGHVRDIAGERDGIVALLVAGGSTLLQPFGADGRAVVALPAEFATVRQVAPAGRDGFVLLDGNGRRLRWWRRAGGAGPVLEMGVLAPGFRARRLAGGPGGRILLAGYDAWGGRLLLVLDAAGAELDRVALPTTRLRSLAGGRGEVWLACADGLWRLSSGRAEARDPCAVFVTPALHSPPGAPPTGWLRAEMVADLPVGSTLSCRIASADVQPDEVDGVPAAMLAARRATLDWSDPVVFAGRAPPEGEDPAPERLALPLHEVRAPWLWLELTLAGAIGAPPPRLRSLAVRYPEVSLMRLLPAIHRTGSDHLRRLVALLETGTQGLDDTIAGLGGLMDPASAPTGWLDLLGSWLGLPWEPDLPEGVRRAILRAAPMLLTGRGTRQALLTLLRCVLPARPVRVVDPMTDLGPMVLGAAALPAVLTGAPRGLPLLNRTAVLGRACLRQRGPRDDPMRPLSGWVLVEVAATQAERAALGGAIARLLEAAVPAGLRVVLRWRPWPERPARLGAWRLQGPGPEPIGAARLGEVVLAGGDPRLPPPASGHAPSTGFRLI